MKVTVNGQDILLLSDLHKQVIQNDIPTEIFEADMKRRLNYWSNGNCFEKTVHVLKRKWDAILVSRGVNPVPTDKEAYAAELLAQPEFSAVPAETEAIILVDDVEEFRISDTKKRIMRCRYRREAPSDFLEQELAGILVDKYTQCMKRLRAYWEPIFVSEEIAVPADDDAFATLIFARPDYKNRSERDAES